jgi:hypothetical protein
VKRPKLTAPDRLLWAWLSAVWSEWQSTIAIVKPATVMGWHRQGFRLFWQWKIRRGKPGRPGVPKEIRSLIRTMSRDNPLWGLWCELGVGAISAAVAVSIPILIRRPTQPARSPEASLGAHPTCLF